MEVQTTLTPTARPCWGCGRSTNLLVTGGWAEYKYRAAGIPYFTVVQVPLCGPCADMSVRTDYMPVLRRVADHAAATRIASTL